MDQKAGHFCYLFLVASILLQSCGKGNMSTPAAPAASSTIGGPGGDKNAAAQQPETTVVSALSGQVREILERTCVSCHGQKSSGGLTNITNLDLLVSSGLIVPGSTDDSLLYPRMLSNMPPPPATLIPKSESGLIADWIRSGAPTDTKALNKNRKSLQLQQDIICVIEADFKALGPAERSGARYFTSWPIWNLNISEEVIKDLDQGLAKFVNSLSLSSKLVLPKALNRERNIFRIFLSDLRWTKAAWHPATMGESYFSFSNQLEGLRALIGDPVPVIRIDEFIALNGVAPRYYELQGLKLNLNAFLQEDIGRKPLAAIYQDVVVGDARIKRYGQQQQNAPYDASPFRLPHLFQRDFPELLPRDDSRRTKDQVTTGDEKRWEASVRRVQECCCSSSMF